MPNPDGSLDSNAVSIYETSNGQSLQFDEIDGRGATAALKVTSHATEVSVTAKTLWGGSENCIDLNNECEKVHVDFGTAVIGGKYAISAKTCDFVSFHGHLSGRASQWEINLGSWSDQSSRTQTGTSLVLTAEFYPIRVWVGNAEIPTMDDPAKYKIIGFGRHGAFVRGLVMFLWSIGKKLKLA